MSDESQGAQDQESTPAAEYNPELPASLEALTRHAQTKFSNIDDLRAAAFVNRLSQGHSEDDIFLRVNQMGIPIEPRLTYKEFVAELDESESRLVEGLPDSVVKSCRQNN